MTPSTIAPAPRRLGARLRSLLPALATVLAATLALAATVPAAAFPGGGFPGRPSGPGGPGGPGGDSPERLTVEAGWAGDVVPGETAVMAVVMQVQAGWKIQAGAGSGDELGGNIPTTITLELPDGWSAGDVAWPEAYRFTLGSGEFAQQLTGYKERAVAAVPVEVPAGADPTAPVRVTVGYQACDESICEMPTSTTVDAGDVPADDADAALARLDGGDGGEFEFGDGNRVDASLAWYEGAVVPGREATLGVVMRMQPDWHIQAGAGSGDDGGDFLPTEIAVDVPEGWEVGDVRWPEAHEFTMGEGEFAVTLAGYEGLVVAVVPITPPADAAEGEQPITVTISVQACDDVLCDMPTDVEVAGTAMVTSDPQSVSTPVLSSAVADAFEATLTRAGVEVAGASTGADDDAPAWQGLLPGFKWWGSLVFVWIAMGWMIVRTLGITKSAAWRGTITIAGVAIIVLATMFVRSMTRTSDVWVKYSDETFAQVVDDNTVLVKFTAAWCGNCHVNERLLMNDAGIASLLERDDVVAMKVDFTGPNPEGDAKKAELGGGGIPLLAVYHPEHEEPKVFRGQLVGTDQVRVALQGDFGEGSAEDDGRQDFDTGFGQFSVDQDAVVVILLLAFAAGFLMNFTPCVLPVVPIKIMSLQAHANNPAECLKLGLIFSAGIVALYAVIGVAMAGLLAGVEELDWGDQFQLWWVNAILGVFILAMGVGMIGLFTISLPQWAYMFNPQSDTSGGSFFMGVFTAVLSTPCTGPLLGATVAWTATRGAGETLITLITMGLGMAFPYVLLVARPKWLEKLPRTGAGSDLLKQVMGLFMIAVAIYFVGVAAESLLV